MMIINQPSNASGSRIPTTIVKDIVAFAKERNIILFSGEVYSSLCHDPAGYHPRLINEASCDVNDYITISVSKIDDQLARYALSEHVRPNLLGRNVERLKTDFALLDEIVARYERRCARGCGPTRA
ncbi:hypothetical protein VUR80DRAFT_649 [Thermomyces stellatus]